MWPHLLLLALPCLALVAAAWFLARHRPRGQPVAHGWRLTALPGYRRALRRSLLAGAAALAALGLTAAATLLGLSRPVAVETVEESQERRDVLLCLDASGSMVEANVGIIDAYLEMLDRFEGARIGLMMFNSTSVMAFPLTDDYEMARELLDEARLGFASYGYRGTHYFTATTGGEGGSLVGDGLASCVRGFDRAEEDRSRSIVLATDNDIHDIANEQIFTVPEAARMAAAQDIHVYALGVETFYARGVSMADLQEAAELTGGEFFEPDAGTPERVVERIQAREAGRVDAPPRQTVHDRPGLALGIAAFALPVALVLLWRARL